MKSFHKENVHIPTEWTGEQAKAVWEFIDEIGSAIWDAHEEEILEAADREQTNRARAARGDDPDATEQQDFPF